MSDVYFAYGSNMDLRQMAARCPGAELLGPATLEEHNLCFCGNSLGWAGPVASIALQRGGMVPGLLYRLAKGNLEALDCFEGAPHVYRRAQMEVMDPTGQRLPVITYLREDPPSPLPPGPEYLARIHRAYIGHDLPAQALQGGWSGLLFVYGTLRQGEANHHWMRGARLVGHGSTGLGWGLFNLGAFPVAIRVGGRGRVRGEVYRVDLEQLAYVDQLEGAAGRAPLYERRMIILDDGSPAVIYTGGAASRIRGARIRGGDWLQR